MKPVRIIFVGLMCGVVTAARADIASTQYVQSLIAQPDWDQDDTTAPDYIQNKPTIPSNASDVGAVPTTRTVNSKALSSDITLTASDVGADASGTAAGLVGTLSNLNTTAQTNVVAAINEVNTALGNINVGVTSVVEGDGNGQIKVNGTNVDVHGLGDAAYAGVAANIADNETGLTTGDQVYDALANKVNTAQGNGNADKAVITNSSGNITTGTISSAMITDGTIANADVASDAAIAVSKISGAEATANKSTSSTAVADSTDGTKKDVNYPTVAGAKAIADAAVSGVSGNYVPTTDIGGVNKLLYRNSSGTVVPMEISSGLSFGVEQVGGSDTYSLFVDKSGAVASGNTGIVTGGLVYTAVDAKQDKQIGAAKVNDADSTDKNKAVIVGADGKMTISNSALGSAAYTASTDYVPTARTVNSKALSSDISLVGSDIALTGYSLPNSTSAIAATDTINDAIGKLEKGLLPVGTTSGTVAAGDDARFDSVSITQPSGTPPAGRVWVWFN